MPEAVLTELLERLSVSIRSAKARAVLKQAGGAGEAHEALDAAAAVLEAGP